MMSSSKSHDEIVEYSTRLSLSPKEVDTNNATDAQKHHRKLSNMEWYAKDMAKKPCMHMCTALVIGLAISVIGITVGNFAVEVDSDGWVSRGTLIADRQMQATILLYNQEKLFGNGSAASNVISSETWNDLMNNAQPDLDSDDDSTTGDDEQQSRVRRTLLSVATDIDDDDQQSSVFRSFGKSSILTPHLINSINKFFGNDQDSAVNPSKYDNVRELFHLSSQNKRKLDPNVFADVPGLKGCDISFYTNNSVILGEEHLWPIWKFKPSKKVDVNNEDYESTFIDSHSLRDICIAEQNTQKVLIENNLCMKCDTEKCMPPYSIVLFARINVGDTNLTLSCDQLGEAWEMLISESYALPNDSSTSFLRINECADELKKIGYSGTDEEIIPEICPDTFHPILIDEEYSSSSAYHYTSSVFATKTDDGSFQALFDLADKYDRAHGSETVQGAYDTQYELFVDNEIDAALGSDMMLAMGSGIVTALAMMVHTKSFWLTSIGLLQVILSFPLAYFVYAVIGRLEFFPFLNFIGVFVSFALGADDVFVAVDKWKNARIELRHEKGTIPTTEEVAMLALPDAMVAMFLTSFTTAIAFFGTAICPIAPLKMFAIFNGLLISFDFIMCVLLVFPALILYDKWLQNSATQDKRVNWLIAVGGGKREKEVYGKNSSEINDVTIRNSQEKSVDIRDYSGSEGGLNGNQDATEDRSSTNQCDDGSNQEVMVTVDQDDIPQEECEVEKDDMNVRQSDKADEKQESFIHRVLSLYFDILYKIRYVMILIIIGTFIFVMITAMQIALPQSSDVRLLDDNVQYEVNFEWRKKLLSSVLQKSAGSQAYIVWGLKAVDTGNVNNPKIWSKLVLDDAFDPSSESAQMYLLSFCGNFFNTEYATEIDDQYICPMDDFNMWLQNQSSLVLPDEIYRTKCGNATSLPLPEEYFDSCIVGWSENISFNMQILQRNGIVEVMYIPYQSRVRFDSPYETLDNEWKSIEGWMKNASQSAPDGVNGMYSTSEDFWWYDTNGNMLKSAFGSAGIALAASVVVVLFAMRSILLSIFSLFTVTYILAAVTAMLVGSGWTLGFLEAICFSILIGISCDFVLHLGHAYTILPGNINSVERSRFAVIHMGPSILAAAFTTISSAIIMIFTTITFFQKFAVILFYTVVTACLGSIVIFVTLTTTFGPSEPTVFIDTWVAKLYRSPLCCTCRKEKNDSEEKLEKCDEEGHEEGHENKLGECSDEESERNEL